MRYSKSIHFAFACSLLSATVLADRPSVLAVVSTAEQISDSARPVVTRQDRIQVSTEGATLLRDGKTSPLRKEITLTDGTRVQPGGGIARADGRALTLAVGEWLDLDGVVRGAAHPGPAAAPASAGGVVSAKGTDSISQAGLELGTAEAERRTNAAIDEAVTAAPNQSAK